MSKSKNRNLRFTLVSQFAELNPPSSIEAVDHSISISCYLIRLKAVMQLCSYAVISGVVFKAL